MATYYRWRRSTAVYTSSQGTTAGTELGVSGTTAFYQSSFPSITNDGYFDLSDGSTQTLPSTFPILIYYSNSSKAKTVFFAPSGTSTFTLDNSSGEWTASERQSKYTILESPGTFVDYVYSTSSSAYPNGGASGSYYYDQRTTVTSPTAPTGLTYPNPITTPTVMLSWDAATSNTSYNVVLYEVSYSINGGSSWVVDSTTGNTTYNFTSMPAGATSIMFRVRAWDMNGQYGNYVTGTASQVISSPTLTAPQMVMQGQPATISWSAIEGADSYTVQRKANTDADWTQVYSGANLSYTETVGTWTSLQYRVQAVFDETPGGWAESAAIPVVSSSALVISGTDGDLGTVVNDIPYSISTDTGNQITATITVNSAVIFSGNVGNSTSDTIPVLDLVNGEGTIVIEASVTASSGPVSAVRTWTYTKTLITFPNAGSVAQLTKEGENIFPKTLAECVRLPGGKTLDEVTAFPCQVYTGSYVGTGTYGQSNPNSLTFPFEPKVVFVRGNGRSIIHMITGCTQAETVKSQGNDYVVTAWDGNSVSWYITDADRQLNMSGQTYYYAAIG